MTNNDSLMYEVASSYYIDQLSQKNIADKYNLSRPKVSRLLAKARETGMVKIKLVYPNSTLNGDALEDSLRSVLGIKNIKVIPTVSFEEEDNLRAIAKDAALYFSTLIRDGDSIGISWGYTLLEIARNFPSVNKNISSVTEIVGNLDNADSSNYANEILRLFSSKLGVDAVTTLPCPAMVGNPIIVDILLHDPKISSIIDQINSVNFAFVNLSDLSEKACLIRTGFVSSEDAAYLKSIGSVGSICSRYINSEGKVSDESFDKRTIGISLNSLKNARVSCVCLASPRKVPLLISAIRDGLINTVAIDSESAKFIIENYK